MEQMQSIVWQGYTLEELSARELYSILAAREAVFVVEQKCAYQELDGLDLQAYHLVGWANQPLEGQEVAAYLRILPPQSRFAEPSLGRVLTTQNFRAKGVGRMLLKKALSYMETHYPGCPIQISAQTYLERFYGSFGFQVTSAVYLEDGIPHVEMRRPHLTA